MLLYLTVIQTLGLFCAHLMPGKVSATIFNALITLGLTAVGGYAVHPRNLSKLWSWSQLISPEKWLLPVLVQDEYSADTLANSAGLQLCRNKQVCVLFRTCSDLISELIKWKHVFCFAGATSRDHCAAAVPTTEWYTSASRFSAVAAQSHTRSERDVRADHHSRAGISLRYTICCDVFHFRVQLSQYFSQETEANVKQKLIYKKIV